VVPRLGEAGPRHPLPRATQCTGRAPATVAARGRDGGRGLGQEGPGACLERRSGAPWSPESQCVYKIRCHRILSVLSLYDIDSTKPRYHKNSRAYKEPQFLGRALRTKGERAKRSITAVWLENLVPSQTAASNSHPLAPGPREAPLTPAGTLLFGPGRSEGTSNKLGLLIGPRVLVIPWLNTIYFIK
jgi:hypothetical protein